MMPKPHGKRLERIGQGARGHGNVGVTCACRFRFSWSIRRWGALSWLHLQTSGPGAMSQSLGPDDCRHRLATVAGIFRERLPVVALRRHVDAVWTNEIPVPSVLEVVPDGCIDIYWSGERLYVAGPNTHIVDCIVPRAAVFVGVRFRPGIGARWLGVSALDLVNRHPALEDIVGRDAIEQVSEKLHLAGDASSAANTLERWVWRRTGTASADDPLARRVVAVARGEAPPRRSPRSPGGSEHSGPEHGGSGRRLVGDLIGEFGCSERTLRRRCEEAFGYGPKTLERILRFQRFLRRLQASRPSLSALAIEAGYADQAHLAREARKLAGQSPTGIIKALQS
jgi:AraC-like DNA-binding protein